MFSMPEHLISLHQKESKRSSNIKAEDNYFYFLERTFLRPLFSKSPVILLLAKELKSCDTKNKLTRKFKSIFKDFAELFGLESIKLKFCQNKSLNLTRSYYHCHKQTIFINKSYFDNFDNKSVKDYAEVLYTLVHEFSHASVDIQFNSDGIHRHDYFFLYVLLDFLTQTSCIKKETFLNNHVQFNKKLLNLDSYSKQDYLIVRAKRKELFHFKTLNSIEDVEQFLLTFEVSKSPNKEKRNVYLSDRKSVV